MYLGGTVEELQQRMSSAEFTLWRAYYAEYPFGYDIDNYRMGTIASAVVNVTRMNKKDMVKPADFYPAKPKNELTARQKQQLELKKRGIRKPRS